MIYPWCFFCQFGKFLCEPEPFYAEFADFWSQLIILGL